MLPFEGPLADDLRAAAVETIVGSVAVVRNELRTPRGLLRLARDTRRQRGALERLVRERDVALVHANTSAIVPAGLPGTVPSIVHVREIYGGWKEWPLWRRALEAMPRLLCVSQAVRDQFGAEARARVVHDGLAVRHARRPREEARAELGIPADAFVAAVVGRITEWKGQRVLAAALAQPGLEDAVGLVAGDAWPGQEGRAQGLGRLRLLGFRDDLSAVLGAADVVVVPSTRPDPLPNAALEAAAAGCCVVAADHGGLPEIVRQGETGVLVAPDDPTALADTLLGLASDPERAARLGAAAARDVPARFARERLLEQVEAVYGELLG